MATTIDKLVAEVKADTGKAKAELKALDAQISHTARNREAEINVRVDKRHLDLVNQGMQSFFGNTAKARGELGRLNNEGKKSNSVFRSVSSSVGIFVQGLRQAGAAIGLLKLPLLISLAGGAVTVITSLGAAVLGLAAGLGRLSGVLATVPQGLSVLGSLGGAAALGFGKIGGAITAADAAKQATGGGAAKGGGAATGSTPQELARKQVDYQRMLEDSSIRIERAERALSDSHRDLADATEDVAKAQEALNKAREDSIKQLERLNADAVGSAAALKQAELDLAEAEEHLARVRRDAFAPMEDLRTAENAVVQAQASLVDAQVDNREAQEELADAQRRGIENSKIQEERAENLANAEERESDAKRNIRDAEIELTRARQDHVRLIEDEKKLTTDQNKASGAAAAAAAGLASAMNELTPAGRAFVQQWMRVKERMDEIRRSVQEAMLPGFTHMLGSVIGLMPTLQTHLTAVGGVIGDTARRLGDFMASDAFKSDFVLITDSNLRIIEMFAPAVDAVVQGLVNLMVAAIPLSEYMASITAELGLWFGETTTVNRENGKLQAWLTGIIPTIETFLDTVGNIIRILRDVGTAAWEAIGRDLVNNIELATQKWADFTGSEEGQNKMITYFEALEPVMYNIFGLVGDLLGVFTRLGNDPTLGPLITQVRDDLLPALEEMLKAAQGDLASKVVDLLTNVANALTILISEGGGLSIIVDVFNNMVEAFIRLSEIPGGSQLITGFATSMALMKAATIGWKVSGMSSVFNVLDKAAGGKISGFLSGLATTAWTKIAVGIRGIGVATLFSFGIWLALIAAVIAIVYLLWTRWDEFVAGLQIIWDRIVAGASWLWEHIQDIFWAFIDWVAGVPGWILERIGDLGSWLWEQLQVGWDWFRDNIIGRAMDFITWYASIPGRLWEAIGDVGRWLWNRLSSGFGNIVSGIAGIGTQIIDFFRELPGRVWSAAGDIGSWLWTQMRQGFEAIPGLIRDAFDGLWEIGRGIGGDLLDGIGNGLQAVGSFATNVANTIWNAFRGLFNQYIADPIRDLGVDIPFAGRITPFSFFPRLAKGAVVDKAMLAMIGEAGPEVVIPLTKPARAMQLFHESGLDRIIASQLNATNGLLGATNAFSGVLSQQQTPQAGLNIGTVNINGYQHSPQEIIDMMYWQAKVRR